MKKIFLFSLIILFTFHLSGQNILEKFQAYEKSHHLEKVYITHDKSFYTPGDTIWCNTYFVDGRTHQFFENASPIIHVEWYDFQDSLVSDWIVKVKEGRASFEIPLSFDISPGTYTLKAFTNYQRNFESVYLFQKKIEVISDITQEKSNVLENEDLLKYDISFFPEGGDIVEGLKNRVAFKAQNSKGEDIDIVGEIVDDSDATIKSFKTFHEGIGYVEFIPQKGENYKFVARYQGTEKSFKLPYLKKEGGVLSIDSKHKEHIILQLQSNLTDGLNGCTLLGHVRGEAFLNQPLLQKESQNLKLLRKDIPAGIVHFTLFDNKDRPISERLCFNKTIENTSSVNIVTSKEKYSKREKVDLELSSSLESDIGSSITLTVYNNDLNPTLPSELTIENYLLLQSDLKGHINDINQYFIDHSSKSNFLLDLIMMTHGWRRFTWKDVLDKQLPEIEFGTQEDISIIGMVKKKSKDTDGLKADVFLSTLSAEGFSSANMTTDDNGIFYFKGFNFSDTTDVIIQANEYNEKKSKNRKDGELKRSGNSNVNIQLLALENPDFDPSLSLPKSSDQNRSQNKLITNYKESRKIDSLYNPTWALEMEEFMVRAQRKTEKQRKLDDLEDKMKDRGMFYFPSSQKIFLDDLPGGGYQYNNLFDIIKGRAPGVKVDGSSFIIRNSTNISGPIPALIQVDGFVTSRPQDFAINPDNILAIDIIKGLSATSVFGEAGAGGVINIITKNPEDRKGGGKEKVVKGTLNFQHPGYYNARQFYRPNYAVKSIDHQKPDLRTTLFWEPNISLEKNSKAFEFFLGDKEGNYLIKIEGITPSGIPFVERKKISIE